MARASGTGYRINGDELRRRRINLALTPDDLALKAGVSHTTVRQAEQGRSLPLLATVKQLAQALECEILDIVTVEPVEEREADGQRPA